MRTIVTFGTSIMLAALVAGTWALTSAMTKGTAEFRASRAGTIDPFTMMKNTDSKRLPVHTIIDPI